MFERLLLFLEALVLKGSGLAQTFLLHLSFVQRLFLLKAISMRQSLFEQWADCPQQAIFLTRNLARKTAVSLSDALLNARATYFEG